MRGLACESLAVHLGVEFETEAAVPAPQQPTEVPAVVLPAPLLAALKTAADFYWVTKLEAHIEEVDALGPQANRLAEQLRGLLRSYDMEAILKLINQNVRTRVEVRGDLMAQYASAKIAEQRVAGMLAQSDPDEMVYYMGAVLDHAERCMRAGIAKLPDGTYQMFIRDPAGNLIELTAPPGAPVDNDVLKDRELCDAESGLYVSDRDDARGLQSEDASLYHGDEPGS